MTEGEIKRVIEKVEGFSGMTVNERLWAIGLMDEFDESMKKDKNKAKRILELIGANNNSIQLIIKDDKP
jgi:hypothetical protein